MLQQTRRPDVCRTRPLRCAIAVSLALASLTAIAQSNTSAASTVETAAARIWNIPAAPLADTLARIARDSGQRLSADPALIAGKTASPVRGKFSPGDAARQALARTGLELIVTEGGTLSVRAAPVTEQRGETTLAPLTVKAGGEQENAWGPVKGYVAKRSATGTKTDTPIIETPQSISVVSSEQIAAQHAQTLQEALRYTSGIAAGAAALNPSVGETFFIRGFQADPQYGSFYRDGMRYMANIYNGKQEPYGLERIEFLKGPASILYGAAAPGGIINTVTKQPQIAPYHEIGIEIGNNNRRQIVADMTGAIDNEGIWSYRLTALGRDSDTFIDHGKDDRSYIAPALTWRPSTSTSLTLMASYLKTRQSDAGTLPANGTLLANPNGVIARDRYLGEPDHNRYNTTTTTLGYVFEQTLTDSLKLRHSLRKFRAELDAQYVLLGSWADGNAQRRINRQARTQNDNTDILTSDTNLQYELAMGRFKHTLLFGIDYSRSEYSSKRQRGALAAIDVFSPTYGTSFITTPWRQLEDNRDQTGFYFQDQIKIDGKWVVLLGGRRDSFENEDVFNDNKTVSKNKAFTGRAGVVYLADNGLAPYLSFSQSFNPTGGTDRSGKTFDPDEGEQYEAGLRYQPKGSDTLLSAAVYQLTRKNVLTPDPVDSSYSVQTGEVRSRGIELEARTKIGRNLNLIAAYTYNDTRITRSNNPLEVGTRFFAAPYHVASLWADYSLGGLGLQGLTVGGGARYVSEKPGSKTSAALGVPAYTLFDAHLGYNNGSWRYALNMANLSDKRYIPSVCYTGVTGCDYGAPRTITASANYRW